MFTVKIIKNTENGITTKVYQCRSYEQRIEEKHDSDGYNADFEKVEYILHGLSGTDDIAYIPMGDDIPNYQKIFFMNQFGKTIDSYVVN